MRRFTRLVRSVSQRNSKPLPLGCAAHGLVQRRDAVQIAYKLSPAMAAGIVDRLWPIDGIEERDAWEYGSLLVG